MNKAQPQSKQQQPSANKGQDVKKQNPGQNPGQKGGKK
jgi:hypothetical protein